VRLHRRIGQAQRLAKLLGGDRAAVLSLERFKLPQIKAETSDGGIGNQLGTGMLHEILKTIDSLNHSIIDSLPFSSSVLAPFGSNESMIRSLNDSIS
jgi:hypothetical protein